MGKFTFVQQNGISALTYDVVGIETVDAIALEMLANNNIECVLPAMFTDNDKKTISYDVADRVTMQVYLRGEVGRWQLLQVFQSVASACMNVEDYMLDRKALLLDAGKIFVDEETGEAGMVYLPVVRWGAEEHDYRTFFKANLIDLVFDENEDVSYVAQLLNYCNGPTFELSEFNDLLVELIDGENAGSWDDEDEEYEEEEDEEYDVDEEYEEEEEDEGGDEIEYKAYDTAAPLRGKEAPPKEEKKPPFEQPAPEEKEDLFFEETVVEEEEPELEEEYVEESVVEVEEELPEPVEEPEEPVEEESELALTEEDPVDESQDDLEQTGAIPQEELAQQVANDKAKQTRGITAFFDEQPELPDSAPAAMERHAWLIREKTGEQIAIDKALFRIGKENKFVDYAVRDNNAVSRSHADILAGEGVYYVVDNNSTNHTFVDGVKLVGNTQAPLKDGCLVQFANERFTFRCR